MELTPGPIPPVDPAQMFRARRYDGELQALVAQAALDLGGAGVAIDGARGTIAGVAGVNVDADLAQHEADLAASNAADDTAFTDAALVDERDATDAGAVAADAGLSAAQGAADAHHALSSQIDEGAAEVPAPPDGQAPPTPPDTSDWPTPPG